MSFALHDGRKQARAQLEKLAPPVVDFSALAARVIRLETDARTASVQAVWTIADLIGKGL